MFDAKLKSVGEKLVKNCREHREKEGLAELYAKDAVSVEAADMGGQGRETKGVEAIKGKHDWWFGAHDVHRSDVEGPFFHGTDKFGVVFDIDVTNKQSGQRMAMKELGLYTVKDGKIVREEFYYAM